MSPELPVGLPSWEIEFSFLPPPMTNPPLPAMVWETTAWEPVPDVAMVPELVKVMLPELELALVLLRETAPVEDPATPPPPPMVWRRTPKLLSPVVEMMPVLVASISPELVEAPAWPAERSWLVPPVV